MNETIPLVDISCLLNKYKTEDDWKNEHFKLDKDVQDLVQTVKDGFETWGFIYVKGHGISEELIEKSFNVSRDFFQCSKDFKMKFQREKGISVGYLPSTGEVFDKTKPIDLKEVVDFAPKSLDVNKQLSECRPAFVSSLTDLFDQSRHVALKLLRLLAVAMGIHPEYFARMHAHIGDRTLNGTSLRTLYYPAVNEVLKDKQQRCGEHTDYGTITLLYQDQTGGLEILSPLGKFVKATPIPGTIVINAGDLMKCWSNGQFLSTVHRVTLPDNTCQTNTVRQSIAFFTHPDYDVTIRYKNQNNESKERNAFEHLKMRFDSTIAVK